LGGCLNSFSPFFPFLAKSSFQIPDLAIPDFKADSLTFCEKSEQLAGQPFHLAPVPDFFSCFVQNFYVFPCIVESSDLSTRTQHDPEVCRDKAAAGTMAESQG